jgi:hypothetical protein
VPKGGLAFGLPVRENVLMLSGKRFRLKATTLGVETVEDHRVAVQVPADETVIVLSGPRPDDLRMVDVLWNDRKLVMFAEDIEKRGQQIVESSGAGA